MCGTKIKSNNLNSVKKISWEHLYIGLLGRVETNNTGTWIAGHLCRFGYGVVDAVAKLLGVH